MAVTMNKLGPNSYHIENALSSYKKNDAPAKKKVENKSVSNNNKPLSKKHKVRDILSDDEKKALKDAFINDKEERNVSPFLSKVDPLALKGTRIDIRL